MASNKQKQLVIIRHAKSSWADGGLSDIDRPLNDRGKSDAVLIAQELKAKEIKPDVLLVSAAKRTQQTARIINKTLNVDSFQVVDELYNFFDDGSIVFDALANLDEQINSVVVFGHNDTFRKLAYRLSDGKIYEFPTCAVLAVSFPTTKWSTVHPDDASVLFFTKPKLLKS